MGKDIICKPWAKVYYELPPGTVEEGQQEEDAASEDEEFLEGSVKKEWTSIELQNILLYLIIVVVILFVGFVLLIYQMNMKKLEIVTLGKDEPRVAIQSTELEAKTQKTLRYNLDRMRKGENTLINQKNTSQNPILDTSLDEKPEDLRKRK